MYVAGTDQPYWCYEKDVDEKIARGEKIKRQQWSEFSLTDPNTKTQ